MPTVTPLIPYQGHHESWPRYADYAVQLDGHTDRQGSECKNLVFSEKRVQSLKDYLVQRFHVVPERVRVVGCGVSAPVGLSVHVAPIPLDSCLRFLTQMRSSVLTLCNLVLV